MLVSIGIHKTKEGWYDSTGQLISFFYWLPNEPDGLDENQKYAGFRIDGVNGTARWEDFNGNDELNVVCTKTTNNGKNNSPLNSPLIMNRVKSIGSTRSSEKTSKIIFS